MNEDALADIHRLQLMGLIRYQEPSGPGTTAWARQRMIEADARIAEFGLTGSWDGDATLYHKPCGAGLGVTIDLADALRMVQEHECPA